MLAHYRVLEEFAELKLFGIDTPINRESLRQGADAFPVALLRGRGPGGRGGCKTLWDVESALSGSAVPWPWRGLFHTRRAPWSVLEHADLVELQWSEMIALAPLLRTRLPNAFLVGIAHDIITQRWERSADAAAGPLRRMGFRFMAARSRRREARSFASLDLLVVFSEKDALLARHLAPELRVEVVHPGLSTENTLARGPEPERPVVLFTGALGRPDNSRGAEWFLRTAWPKVVEAVPEARLVIAGANPPESLRRAVEAATSAELTGFVESLEPYYARASVFVAPLLTGAGVKFKTVDAMLRRVPVVATSVGAEGIDAHELFAAVDDDPEVLAGAIVRELREPDMGRTAKAASWAERTYGYDAFRRRLTDLYNRAARR